MSWKQPTPTDINECKGLDFLDKAIFREILSYCQNEPFLDRFEHAGRKYQVELQRGQCILKVLSISNSLKIDRKRVRKSVATVSKWYTPLDIRAKPYGLIITVLCYDEIVKMDSGKDNSGTTAGQQKDNRRTPNKSIEDIKELKDKENNFNKLKLQKKKISFDWFQEYPILKVEEFKKTFDEFLTMRKTIRKPLTEHATKLLLNRLVKLAGDDVNLKIEILNQSTLNSWQDVYELKQERKSLPQQLSFQAQDELLRLKRKKEREEELARIQAKHDIQIAIEDKKL